MSGTWWIEWNSSRGTSRSENIYSYNGLYRKTLKETFPPPNQTTLLYFSTDISWFISSSAQLVLKIPDDPIRFDIKTSIGKNEAQRLQLRDSQEYRHGPGICGSSRGESFENKSSKETETQRWEGVTDIIKGILGILEACPGKQAAPHSLCSSRVEHLPPETLP